MKRILVIAAMAVPLLFGGGSAEAWIITQISPAPGSGFSESVIVPIDTDPGVDKVEIHKYFLNLDSNDTEVPIILNVTREAGDQDVIQIIDEIVLNLYADANFPQDWIDYHVQLIRLPGQGDVSFIDPDQARAMQAAGGPTRLGGDPNSWTAKRIDWETVDPNQYVPWGTFASAPDNQLVLLGLGIDVSDLAVGETFQFKQWPTTPEPATLTLLVAGIAVVVRRRRRSA